MTVHISDNHEKITELLNRHHIGILATASSDGTPHAATIYFFADDDFNIFFITKDKTTKQQNLAQNPKAALAIFEASTQTTLQISGTVTKIQDLEQHHEIYRRVAGITLQTTYKETPPFSKLDAGSEIAYCLKPDRVRLAQYMQTQQQVEKNFDIFELVEQPPKV